jgi:hypothetical protein
LGYSVTGSTEHLTFMHIGVEVRWGHILFAIELPVASVVQARDVQPPNAPLLVRVAEAARGLGVSRSENVPAGRVRAGTGGQTRALDGKQKQGGGLEGQSRRRVCR